MLIEQKNMEKSSFKLPPILSNADGLPIYFLTGKNYLYQTLYCIHSLIKVSNEKFRFTLIDDGSFDRDLIERINLQLPHATIITRAHIEQNINAVIPQYSHLLDKRKVYQHIKKLTDVHSISGDQWKLVLDSDMLFLKEPKAIIDWLKKPEKPLYMVDCMESYGYSHSLMENICGEQIPKRINVGVIGLNSNQINWQNLNNWVNTLEKQEGTSYFLEQALTAMILGQTSCVALNALEYVVNPSEDLINKNQGILHHYVDLSKEGYFKKAWRKI